ncbi:MAG: kynureninase [Proteobacteria bacterium]|nr:kynureninase [Pseudomonadota bacterium]MBS0461901.1 kynureninase [Pseudomonadota bacterium]MBS0463658.1 kynureninase [Pseudomonadota bacterium]
MTIPHFTLAASEADARTRDAADPLRDFRDEFLIPPATDPTLGEDHQLYFTGNSLGLQPRGVREALLTELDDWARLGVEAHFHGRHPWMPYHEEVRGHLAEITGALPSEVVAMNSLTTNLHLMMVSFYRPTTERHAIVIEAGSFPSDRYAVESQIRFHGFDPATALIEVEGDPDTGLIGFERIERALHEHGSRTALVLWPGVQYRTGEAFDLKHIARLAHAHGAAVGFDLAHAAGNLQLALHDADADFAAWCSYKYLNAGPGAIAGCFVHERHARAPLPRFAGWWGHDQSSRFQMGPTFAPTPGADGWQLSNPPIMALAPLRASLDVFHRAGMGRLREKSIELTAYLEALIRVRLQGVIDIVTPPERERRGCQLSLRVIGGRTRGRALFEHLNARGIIGDWREPDVIRVAPTPLYNRFVDAWKLVDAIVGWRDAAH